METIIPAGTPGEYFGPTGTSYPRPFVTTRDVDIADGFGTFSRIPVRFDDTERVGAVSWGNVELAAR